MKPDNDAASGTTLQDWLDIVWQSAIQAQEKGLNVQFVDLGSSAGIRIFGVTVRDGRPYLTTTDTLIPQVIEGDTNGRADTTVVDG